MRLFGEAGDDLAAAGVDTLALAAAERTLEQELGLPPGRIVDAHVHLGRDADGHALEADDLVADLDRWGIARAVCFAADEPGEDGTFGPANAAVAEAARRHPARIVPFCRVDPGVAWEQELERAAAAGARGLKLHPVAQSFRPEGPESVAAVAAATELGWPVLLHAGFGARRLAGPMRDLADAVPGSRLILAHGGRGDARALAAAFAGEERVRFDTSLAALPDLVALPPQRLCFGSDRPYGEHASALQLVALAARVAGWSERETAGVLGANLEEWLEA